MDFSIVPKGINAAVMAQDTHVYGNGSGTVWIDIFYKYVETHALEGICGWNTKTMFGYPRLAQ